ncbi:histidine kinase [Oceanisphaera avium]|uniref:Uncharacterized protein n=1 Tax=Oceanisphaera avium TaxID=1903694 RepID=A0A1Y0D091_9GAMM|nr:HAMP domain-containing histidine kinase [Oceanisphaera avium]ART80983.1 hypothetical protein CBP12_13140 [Oceanisphaera avium]
MPRLPLPLFLSALQQVELGSWPMVGPLTFVLSVRWLFFIALSCALLFTDWVLLPILSWELLGLLLLLLLSNGVITALGYYRRHLAYLKEVALVSDIILLTAIIYFSGGAMNPAVALYLFPLLIAAITCRAAFAWGCVASTMLSYLGLFYWFKPMISDLHVAHGAPTESGLFNLHLLGMWLTFSLSAVLITGTVSWLMRLLATKEQLLQQAYQKQQEQEQFLLLGLESASLAHQFSTPLSNLFLLSEELSCEPHLSAQGQQHLTLLHQQLELCRQVLWQLKHQAESRLKPVYFYQQLRVYLARWTNLRPDAELAWQANDADCDICVWLDNLFWSALLNILDNAADAGNNKVELVTRIEHHELQPQLYLDIYNRQGHLSDEQLAQAGLNQQDSEKTTGLGMGVWLAHATFSRLKGSLTLRNNPAGVYMPIFSCRCASLSLLIGTRE